MATFPSDWSRVQIPSDASDDEIAAVIAAIQTVIQSPFEAPHPKESRWARAGWLEAQGDSHTTVHSRTGWGR